LHQINISETSAGKSFRRKVNPALPFWEKPPARDFILYQNLARRKVLPEKIAIAAPDKLRSQYNIIYSNINSLSVNYD
jgi:hypothetical protein